MEEGLGWASEGWTAKKAFDLRNELQAAYTRGEGANTLAGKRDENEKLQNNSIVNIPTYKELTEKHYIPWAKQEKKSGWLDVIRLNNHIYKYFGDIPLDAITRTNVEKFKNDLLKEFSPATTKQILALLRKTLNYFASIGLYDKRNPVSGIKMPRIDNECERFLTRSEYDKILEATCETQCFDLHDAVILSVHTGLRLGEISRLDFVDVDLENLFLTVREDGGKPGGKVPLNSEAAKVLSKRLLKQKSGLVFPPTDSRGKALSKQFTWLALAIGLNSGEEDRQHRLTFHSLRHTFASWLALADVDLYRIQKLMRHKTPAMTQRYAHLRPSWLRENVDVLCSPPSHQGSGDV